MPLDFDKHAQKGNNFLIRLSAELHDKGNKARAGKALRAVLRALRDHLTLEENFQLLSQLPMALKGVYVDGWVPGRKKERSRKKLGFIMEVARHKTPAALGSAAEINAAASDIQAVFKTLRKYVSAGEFNDVRAVLPRQLKELLEYGVAKAVTVRRIGKKKIDL
ncbi:MAG: DUF2267 domain-containing protein [Bacteroidota bacterium]